MPILKPPKGALLNRGHPLARGLVGYWLMNEGAGTRAGNLITPAEPIALTNVTWGGGKSGPSLYFPGSSSSQGLITCAGPTLKFQSAASSFSVVTWVRLEDMSTYQAILWIQDVNDDMWRLLLWNDRTIRASADAVDFSSTTTITYGQWYQVAAVFDKAGNGQIYLNGKADGSPVALNGEVMDLTTNSLYVAISPGPSYPLKGNIDHILILNRALTAGEIAQLYREPFGLIARPRIELWTGALAGGGPGLVACPYYARLMAG